MEALRLEDNGAAFGKGGRTIILFLLFCIGLYNLTHMGLPGLAVVCLLPVIGVFLYLCLQRKMFLFYVLLVANYFVSFASRSGFLPIPISAVNEMLEVLLLILAMIDTKDTYPSWLINTMSLGVLVWVIFTCVEIFNTQCGIPGLAGFWYTGVRLMTFQIVYATIVVTLYITSPKMVKRFVFIWAIFSIISAFWVWKQQTFGFTEGEKRFLVKAAKTHILNGLIRYFSVFTDAANYGCHMAAATAAFGIISIYIKTRKLKIFYIVTCLLCCWAMFATGTRTAIFCLIAGIGIYIFLSKSAKMAVPVGLLLLFIYMFLAFTKIANGNATIRRMRSAFNKEDASLGVREINKNTLRKYMKDLPWGVGIGVEYTDLSTNNQNRYILMIPPDSEYVYIWVRTGKIGLIVFIISTLIMFCGAAYNVLFRIRDPEMRGISAAFTCAFVAIHLGGYANQILLQYPNVIIFYGGLALANVMPMLEREARKRGELPTEEEKYNLIREE